MFKDNWNLSPNYLTFPYLNELKKVLLKEGIREAYLVGGCLRDLLLQRSVQDWDIAVKERVKEIAFLFAQIIDGHFVVLDEKWQTYRVVKPPTTYFDFTPLRGQDIYADLWERDFTINALALDILTPDRLIDPTGGQEDIKKRLIRMIAPKAFLDDPLRILRGLRLAAELDFELELKTKEIIKRYAPLLEQVAAERIYQEFKRLFFTLRTARWVKEMGRLNVFKVLLPEIEALKGVTQDGFHHLDVYAHSLLALEKIEEVIYAPLKFFSGNFKEISAYLAVPLHRFCLKWAALCHDLGKPVCRAEGEKRITFYEHDKVGARLFKEIASRLRFPRKETELIVFFIEKHMWPFHLLSLFLKNELTLRAIRRFIRKTEPHTIGLLLLAMADNLAAQGVGKPDGYDEAFLKFGQTVLEERRNYLQLKQKPRLVTGHDLIRWFQLSPGPVIGQLLQEIEEAQLNGEIRTREEARRWLEKRLKDNLPLAKI